MNVSGPLLLLLLTAACTVSGEDQLNSVLELWNINTCVQPDVNPLKYADYGCFCGLGGQGTPVDEVDQCCKVHDDCYGACMDDPECEGFFKKPYFLRYQYTCTRRQPTCSRQNDKCQAAVCECDRVLALCFAQAKYNSEYAFMDQTICKK